MKGLKILLTFYLLTGLKFSSDEIFSMKLSCIIFFLLISFLSKGQVVNHITYTEKDGLPSSTVYDVTQDKDGFMWFATQNGLSRFDGKRFTNYTIKDGLPDNTVIRVIADSTNRVFFSTLNSIPLFIKNNKIQEVKLPSEPGQSFRNIFVYNKHQGGIYFMTQTKDYFINNQGEAVSLLERYKFLPETHRISVINDSLISFHFRDSVYAIKNNRLSFIGKHGGKKILLNNIAGNPVYTDVTLTADFSVGQFIENNIFYATDKDNIYYFNSLTGKSLFKLTVKKCSRSFIDLEGNIWVTTQGNGIVMFPSLNYKHVTLLNQEEVFKLTKQNNDIWVGADYSKIFTIQRPDVAIADYSHHLERSGNLTAKTFGRNRVTSFLKSGNETIIGTDAFLLYTNKGKTKFRNIYPVKDIEYSKRGLLVSTGRCLLLLDKMTLEITDTLFKHRTSCSIELNNAYYTGTEDGLCKISYEKEIIQLYKKYPALSRRITTIITGNDNDLWVGTSGSGIINIKNDRIIRIIDETTGLISNISTSLFLDNDTLWAGTDKGVSRISKLSGKTTITNFKTSISTSSTHINSILVDDQNIYAATPFGVMFFNKSIKEDSSICLLHIEGVSANDRRYEKRDSYTFPYNELNIQIDFTAISFKSAGDITYYYKLDGLNDNWESTTENFINYATLPPGKYTFHIKAVNKFGQESLSKSIDIQITPPWWQTIYFKTGLALLLTTAIIYLYFNRLNHYKKKIRQKQQVAAKYTELEQKILLAQLNPHFIFNCLNSIQSFVLTNDVEGANTYITVFGSLVRQTLENSTKNFITIEEEVKYLSTYLKMEQLRHSNKFSYEIIVENQVKKSNLYLPTMLLQPFVENAIKHGIQHRKDNKGHISITISSALNDELHISIRDNGIGRKKSSELTSKLPGQTSKGIDTTLKRIETIKILYKKIITIGIDDTSGESVFSGTCVKLTIPNFSTR